MRPDPKFSWMCACGAYSISPNPYANWIAQAIEVVRFYLEEVPPEHKLKGCS